MKVCVRNMIYWAIFVSRWLRLSPGVSVLGLLSLFPLFPSLLIRQGSVPAGENQEVSLSYLSFFPIIVLDSLKFLYVSYHIKINKKFLFFISSKYPQSHQRAIGDGDNVHGIGIDSSHDRDCVHRLIWIEGLTNSQGGYLYQDCSFTTRYTLGLKKLVSLHEMNLKVSVYHSNK